MKVKIKLCNKCNMICNYCSFKDSATTEEINLNSIINILQDKDIGTKVIFSGGEPLLKFELIKTVIETFGNKFNYSIITNGLLLEQNDILDYIIKKDIKLIISFDGVENSDRNCDNIKLLELIQEVAIVTNPTISMSITNSNVNNIKSEINKLYNINIRNVFLKPILDNEDFIPNIQDYHIMVMGLMKLPDDITISFMDSMESNILSINSDNSIKEKINMPKKECNYIHNNQISTYLKIGNKFNKQRNKIE